MSADPQVADLQVQRLVIRTEKTRSPTLIPRRASKRVGDCLPFGIAGRSITDLLQGHIRWVARMLRDSIHT